MAQDKKVALVTGCSSGLGLETAIGLAKNGYKTYATSRNLTGKKGDAIREKIKKEKLENIEILDLDVTNQEQIDKAFETVMKEDGRIDLVINNAAYTNSATIEFQTLKSCKHLFEVNYFGVMRIVKKCVPIMRKQKSGTIVAISSDGGFGPYPFVAQYCASKAAIEGFVASEAPVLKLSGINILTYLPGYVASNLVTNAVGCDDGDLKEYQELYGQANLNIHGIFKHLVPHTAEDAAKALIKVSTQKEFKGHRYASEDSSTRILGQIWKKENFDCSQSLAATVNLISAKPKAEEK